MKKSFLCLFLFFAGAVFFNSCKIVDGDDLKTLVTSLQSLIDKTEEGGTLDLSSVESEIDISSVEINRSLTLTASGETPFDMKGAMVTVNASGVVLKNLTNLGTVTAGEKIEDGDFILENCEVAVLDVNGGGENSIHLTGAVVKKLNIKKEDVSGNTALYDAIIYGLDILNSESDDYTKTIIAMTDGEANVGLFADLKNKYQLSDKIPIYSITFGSASETQLLKCLMEKPIC